MTSCPAELFVARSSGTKSLGSVGWAPGSRLRADHPVIYQKVSTANPSGGSSYGQILKSSSILGGAQAMNYVVGLIRTKVVAVLLGPSGVGLVGLYVSIVGMTGTIAQLGIGESGVREVANAAGSGDQTRIAAAAKTLRRACWATGVLGWVLTAALSWPLTQWTFGATEHVWSVAILGAVALLEAVSSGQKALLQGLRRVGDIARIQIAAAVLTTLLAVGIYAWLREDGIVPVIILTSLVQLSCSWFFARRVGVQEIPQPWQETWRNFGQLFKLGSALMYGAVLTAMAGLAIRALMVRDLGLEAAGLYQAAWMLSGMFGAIVLQALATDFYPRLAGVAQDNAAVNRLMNEQIEVGMLLALPGVIGAVAFAPWLIHLLYSSKFTVAADLLPWLVVGVFGQVVTWPLGMIMQARAATGWLYFSRTHGAIVQFASAAVLIYVLGLLGAAIGFLVYICLQGLLALLIARRMSGFRFHLEVLRIMSKCVVLIIASAAAQAFLPPPWSILAPGLMFGLVLAGSACELRKRLPAGNLLDRWLEKLFAPKARHSR